MHIMQYLKQVLIWYIMYKCLRIVNIKYNCPGVSVIGKLIFCDFGHPNGQID